MGRHRALVSAESDAENVTITITCDACKGGTFTIATAHMETLARVLPKICKEVGFDLDKGSTTEAITFDAKTPENLAKAREFYEAFMRERKAREN